MDEYTLLKKQYLYSLCLAGGLYYQDDGNQDTFFNSTRVNIFKLIPYALANIIFFLSFRRKKIYKNFPFCQLVYLLQLTQLYFFYL